MFNVFNGYQWPPQPPSQAAVISSVGFFERPTLLKAPEGFSQGPFVGRSPTISGNYFTQPFFDVVRPKNPIIIVPDVTVPFPFKPAMVQQPLFERVAPKRPTEFVQGPFAQTSPAIAGNYFTSGFFDAVRPKPTVERLQEAFGVPFPRPVLTTAVWFEALRLLKLPERLSESPIILPPTPILISAFFDVVKKLQPLAGLDASALSQLKVVTIQNALTDWFALVRPKQPLVETPIITFYPPQQVIVPAQYRLLSDHYINNAYLIAGTIVTEGLDTPFGWVPTIASEPLNAQAIQAYWNAGPRLGAERSQDFYILVSPFMNVFSAQTNPNPIPAVFWQQVPGQPNTFILTGAGASLGAKTNAG